MAMLAQLQAHNRALRQEVAREIADAQALMASLQVGGWVADWLGLSWAGLGSF